MTRSLVLGTGLLASLLVALSSGGCSAVDPGASDEGDDRSESPLVGHVGDGGASSATGSGATSTSATGSSSASTGGSGGGTNTPCTCPYDPTKEYLPKEEGVTNDCGKKEERPVCETAYCTVAVGDPNDDELDYWELRNCSWPVEPLPEPGSKPCRCPFGTSGKNERITEPCPDSDTKQSCEWAKCTVEVWEKPGDYGLLEMRDCGWNGTAEEQVELVLLHSLSE